MVYLHTAIKLFNVTVVNVTGELLSVGEKRLSLLYMFDFLYSDSYNKFVTVQYLHSHAQNLGNSITEMKAQECAYLHNANSIIILIL